jgi:hypothetical protein
MGLPLDRVLPAAAGVGAVRGAARRRPRAPRAVLAPSLRLFKKTRFRDNDPSPPQPGVVGGAERLPPGIYEVVFHVTLAGGARHALRGVRFEVAAKDAPGGGWQIKPPPQAPNR